jgi:CDP-glucose 4,6-dehydratase
VNQHTAPPEHDLSDCFERAYHGVPVLVTGHTGFKGSWLSIWLAELGAQVIGYSLDPPTTPSNFALSGLNRRMVDVRADVRDSQVLLQAIQDHQPQIVYHLAAQPLVLPSYREPKETFETNVSGTVNLLEGVRHVPSVRAVVCVTTDKVYENREWVWGYRENDRLGGHDPYSASKAMAELAIASYRQSFFPANAAGRPDRTTAAIASARAGNVIGGGDWGEHRLIPDCIRAWTAGQPVHLRNPGFVRPWQLLLEPLAGYLWLGARLLGADGHRFAEPWNFGPHEERGVTTEELVADAIRLWGDGSYTIAPPQAEVETAHLRLNWDKAAHRLAWRPVYDWRQALAETIGWYKEHIVRARQSGSAAMYDVCVDQIARYVARARARELCWARAGGSDG